MPRGEDHRKKGPTLPHLPCQINAVHGTGKPDVGEDHGDVSPTDQHDCKRSFRAFALDGVDLLVLRTVPPRGYGVQRRPRRSIWLDIPVPLAPWPGPLRALVVIGIQSAHERRQPSRERGRNSVDECGPQLAPKRQRESHSVGRYLGPAHLAPVPRTEPPLALASMSTMRQRGFCSGPMRENLLLIRRR